MSESVALTESFIPGGAVAVDYEALSLPHADEDTLNISQVMLGQQIYEGAWTPPPPAPNTHTCSTH